MSKVFEIEIDGPRNERLMFPPLQRSLRGRFDVNRVLEPEARRLSNKIPTAIPGMRLSADLATGECAVIEAIHEDRPLKARLAASRPVEFAPEREVAQNAHLPTWLYWMKRAVESGVARIVRGELPQRIEGEPQKNFYTPPAPKNDTNERLAAALEAQTAVMTKLLEHLAKK
jgi:hypothetical protein